MKRNLDNLTEKDISYIKDWLDGDPACCPGIPCTTCYDLLPRKGCCCPCRAFSLYYIIKTAEQVIEQWEAAHGPSK